MPQFDKITFFNQIFWLFFFFSGFYLVLLKFFLPKLSSVLKARAKKLRKGSDGVLTFSKEQDHVTNLFNASLEEMSTVVKTSITKTSNKMDSSLSHDFASFNYAEIDKTLNLNSVPVSSGQIAISNSALEKVVHTQFVTSFLFSHPQIAEEDLSSITGFEEFEKSE